MLFGISNTFPVHISVTKQIQLLCDLILNLKNAHYDFRKGPSLVLR